jgi:hypothetical protein
MCSKPIHTLSYSHGRINLASPTSFATTASLLEIRLAASVLRPMSPGMGPSPFEPDIQYKPPESLTSQPCTNYRRRGPSLRDR